MVLPSSTAISALELQASDQQFVPQEGTLYTTLDYGSVKGKAETWLHPTLSILIERYTFDQAVMFQAWMGPGVWPENNGEPWDTDPFRSVTMSDARRRTLRSGRNAGDHGAARRAET